MDILTDFNVAFMYESVCTFRKDNWFYYFSMLIRLSNSKCLCDVAKHETN